MPAKDDGSRDDPLLSDRAKAVVAYVPDVAALTAWPGQATAFAGTLRKVLG